jgi:hypothetical protein
MTKSLLFDLEFGPTGVKSLSKRGEDFLIDMSSHTIGDKALYDEAIDDGLHVRFSDHQTRDKLSGYTIATPIDSCI